MNYVLPFEVLKLCGWKPHDRSREYQLLIPRMYFLKSVSDSSVGHALRVVSGVHFG